MDYKKIGNAIKKLRIEAGYTQNKLADCLSVTDKAVSKWERGLSVPDISIIMELANLLNCDVDNLLEGNITHLVRNWQGLLILDDDHDDTVCCDTEVYGKPVVYFLLSYFVLAGIRNIYIICRAEGQERIRNTVGEGDRFGIQLTFISKPEEMPSGNTMVVNGKIFVFGPNLTRYFQRAMSRLGGISVLTQEKTEGNCAETVYYDNNREITNEDNRNAQSCIPIFFFPEKWTGKICHLQNIRAIQPLYAEPMDNGMIAYELKDEDAVLDTALFLHYMKKRMGKDIYNLTQVAHNRFFLD